jgi:carbamate kinase
VVDKDLAAAILAHEVHAGQLLILTDVAKVQRGFGTLYAEPIDRLTATEAVELARRGEFGAGSMGPKIDAALAFLEQGGRRVVIADLDEGPAALRGDGGTELVADP